MNLQLDWVRLSVSRSLAHENLNRNSVFASDSAVLRTGCERTVEPDCTNVNRFSHDLCAGMALPLTEYPQSSGKSALCQQSTIF